MKRLRQPVPRDPLTADSCLPSNGAVKMHGRTMTNQSERGSPAPAGTMGHCEPREHTGKQPAFPRADLNLLSDARSLGMEGQEPRL